ncbi:MAG: queuosine precursor transporter [candidate division WOR-3 bacterium]
MAGYILSLAVWLAITLAVITIAIWLSKRLGLLILEVLHALLVVSANITVYKTFTIAGLIFTGGDLTYNSAYSLLDVIHRRGGYERSKRLIWITLLANIAVALFLWTVSLIPTGPDDILGRAYDTLFRMDLRIVASSMLSFLVSSRVDVWVAHRIGIERRFFLAFLLSNLSASAVDSVLFNTLAFWGVLPLLPLIAGQFVIKLIVTLSNFLFILYARWLDKKVGARA